jgi:hypothetical protein
MKTQATQENILKYLNVLKVLHHLLSYSKRISMLDFSVRNKVTKNLSTVLSKGGIIKCIKSGRNSEWEWASIEPTREMAIKVLQELATLNPERKNNQGGKRENSGRKTKEVENRKLESLTMKLLFGLIKINITLNYK